MTKRLADWVRAGESRVRDCMCHCLAAAVRNPGWGVKVARFALTCVGCWKSWELIRSCCSSIYGFPSRGQGLLIHLSHTAFRGFSNGQLQQIIAAALAVLPTLLSCGCIIDAGCMTTVCSHLSGYYSWQRQAKKQRDGVLKAKEYYMHHFNLSSAQKKANHQTSFFFFKA